MDELLKDEFNTLNREEVRNNCWCFKDETRNQQQNNTPASPLVSF